MLHAVGAEWKRVDSCTCNTAHASVVCHSKAIAGVVLVTTILDCCWTVPTACTAALRLLAKDNVVPEPIMALF